MRLIFCILLVCMTLSASTVTISISGTWGTLSMNDAYFASNEPWTLSFQVTNPPPVINSNSNSFETNYSNASYTLNGNPVPVTASPELVYFLMNESFDIILSNLDQMTTNGFSPQLFNGPTTSPTLIPGTYQTTQPASATINNVLDGFATAKSTINVDSDSAVPEPASWILAVTGLVLAGRARHAARK